MQLQEPTCPASPRAPSPRKGSHAPYAPSQLQDAAARVAEAARVADVPGVTARLAAKENDASSDGVWDDAAAGQALMAEIAELKGELAELARWGGCRFLLPA